MFSYLQNPLFLHFWGIFLVLECSEVVAWVSTLNEDFHDLAFYQSDGHTVNVA
jgi:hypothetical protein